MVLAIRNVFRILDPHAVVSYSQEGEDLVLLRLFERRREGFYVDVGAHHPMRFSNTCIFHERGWRGINIDPDPTAIALFQKCRPDDTNLQLGISDVSGTLNYYYFNEHALNTFDPVLARKREHIPGYRLEKVLSVPVRRLEEVLAESLPANQLIDFLSVDAEGYDLNVLKSNNWSRFRPSFVLAEALECTLVGVSENPICKYLFYEGYELYAKTINTLVFRDAGKDLQR
jgi:FkbM family methyltransferase